MLRNVYAIRSYFVRFRRLAPALRQPRYALTLLLGLLLSLPAVGQISGTVFRDYNADGAPTSTTAINEPGIASVTVTAVNTAGAVAASTVTNAAGSYTLTLGTGQYRVQFTGLATGDFSGPVNTTATGGSGSSVQFVTAPVANVNFGVNYPTDYCQANPQLVTSCYVFGNQTTGSSNTDPVFISFPYTAGSRAIAVADLPQSQTTTAGIYDAPTSHTIAVAANRVGTTFGVAHARTTNRIYTSAFFKKHAGFGPSGPGAIYVINPTTNAVVSTFTVPASTSNAHNTADYTLDNGNAGWDAVGKTSLGGMDLSDDDQTLYVVNLENRRLYALNATTGVVSASAALAGLLPTGCAACTATNDVRPFTVEFYRGRVYVGLVYTAETSVSAANLRAYVYSADAATLTFRTTADFVMPLNYPRNKAATTGIADWQPWRPTYTNISTNLPARLVYPMPMFGSLAFDNDNLIIGLRDRIGDIIGNNTPDNPANTANLYQARTAGDILRAAGSPATGWTLEGNGRSGGNGTATQNTDQGPGGAEFYQGDAYPLSATVTGSTTYTAASPTASGTVVSSYTITTGGSAVTNGSIGSIQGFGENHDEVSLGTVLQVPGFRDVVAVVFDPLPDNGAEGFFDGGIRWLNNTTGSWAQSYRIYNGDGDGIGADFGKAAGLGDLAVLCDSPPIEIGNRVFNDGSIATADGLQGATNSFIAGLTVQLYLTSTSALVGTATTNSNGQYYFNSTNVAGGLLPNTAYEIRVPLGQTALAGYFTTRQNVGTDDALDSDASTIGTNAVISLTTGNYGENNHTYDIGFALCPTISNPSGSQTVCSGTPVNSLTVATSATGAGAIRFVYFTSPQTGTAVYVGGTSLATATPASGTAGINNVIFPANTGTTAITYYVYAILNPTPSAEGCRPSALIQVTIRPVPVATATVSGTVTCARSATVTGNSNLSGSTFAWTGPGGFASTQQSFTTNTPGTYSLVVTTNGCSSSVATATVTQDITPPQDVSLVVSRVLNCTATTAVLTASSSTTGVTYRFAGPGVVATAGSSATVNAAGTYSVTATGPNGCTATTTVPVTQDITPPAGVTAANDGPITCAKPTATVSATSTTAGVTYRWTGPGNFATTSQSFTTATAGTYSVTVTAPNGCTAVATTTVAQDLTPPQNVSLAVSRALNCTATTAVLTASSSTTGVSYRFAGPGVVATAGSSATVNAAGTYSVTVTSANGCTAVTTATVTQDITSPVVSATNTGPLTCTLTTVTVTASTTTASATYRWSSGQTTASFTTSTAGTYSVTVTAPNGCTGTASTTVTSNTLTPSVSVNSLTLTCAQTSGTLTATVTNATSPTYRWNTTATTASITVSAAGPYSVTVTSANGCTAAASTTVQSNTLAPVVSATNTGPLTCTLTTVTVTASTTTADATYRWSSGQTTPSFTTTAAGTYSVTVTAPNGCTSTASTTVTQDLTPPQNVSLAVSRALNCTATTAVLTASSSTTGVSYRFAGPGVVVSSGASATVNAAGTYSVTATSANGCTAVTTATVTQDVTPPVVSATNTGPLTCTLTTVTVTATTTAGATYRWSSGQTTASFTTSTAGTYSVTVTAPNGCTSTVSTTVVQDLTPPQNVSLAVSRVLNCTATTAVLTASSSTTGVTYRFAGPGVVVSSGASATVNAAGTYSVTATGPNGCTTTATTAVQSDTAAPTAFAANDGPITCANPIVTVSVSPTAVGSAYRWSSGQTTASFSTTVAGTYSVTVTGANGCTATASTTVTQPPALSASTTQTNPTCNGGTNGSATVTATGGTPAYRYAWSNGATTPTVSGLTAGVYSVTVTDANACTLVTSVTLTQPPALTLSAAVTNVACNGAATGSVDLTVAGGTAPYQYAWSNGAISQDITGVRAGTYTVTVTDQNGCVSRLTTTVTEPPALTLTTTKQDVTCNGGSNGSIDLTVAGGTTPYSYSWTNGSGQLVATTQDVTNLPAGTYNVLVTDANACIATSRVIINQPTAITLATTQQNVRCNGAATGSIDLTVAGGTPAYAYRWSTGATTQDLTGLVAGVYSVTVTDANGCTAVTSVTISQPPALTLTTTAQNPDCNGGNDGSIDLTVTGGTAPYSFAWNDNVTAEDRTGLRAGTYSVVVTDANGCTATTSVTLTQPDVLSISGAVQPVTCFGQSNGAVSLTVTGGTTPYSFTWTNGNGQVIATTQNIANLSAGNYSVTVTDAAGCQQVFTAAVSQPEQLVIDAEPIEIACPDQTVDIATISVQGGVGPYQYRWTGPNNFTANTPSIFDVPPGSYTLVVTDANRCTAVEIVDIVVPPPFNLSTQVTPVSCFGGTNGAIDVTVTGASPPYSFTWSNGARTEDLTGIVSGTYSVSVTDRNNCMTSITAVVGQPTELVVSETHTNVTCFDGQNGTIDLTVSGGTAPYSFAWNDNVASEDRTDLRAGTYTVTVTDANGCQKVLSVLITQPPALTLSAQVSDVACNGNSTGAISLTATGGTGTLTYRWSTGATSASISSLTAGVYSVTVTDANGCVAEGRFRVNQPDPLQLTFTQQNIACNGAATGSISVNVTGGTTPYQYVWSDRNGEPAGTGSNRTGLTAGVYALTVTDANGCTASISVTISQPPALTLTATQQNVQCFGQNNGSIDVTTGGGVAPYTFRWNDGTANEDRTGLAAGVYSLTVTDNNGCTATTSATITQPELVTVTAANTGPLTCTLTTVTVSASSLTGVSYQWTGPAGFVSTAASFTTSTPGTYVVVVTGINGCSATAQTEVGQDITTPVVSANNTGPITCANPTATVSALSNRTDVSYRWSNGETTATFSTSLAGTYSVTVTAANGCTATASTIVSQTLITATLTQGSCNFNGTNATAADDYFLITVQATSGGSAAPNRYEVVLGANADGTGGTVLNPGGTPFDQPVTVGSPTTFRADGATTYTLTIRDITSSGCKSILTTTPVASCSSCESVQCPRVAIRRL